MSYQYYVLLVVFCLLCIVFVYIYGYHRNRPVLTPSFPTRRSADLLMVKLVMRRATPPVVMKAPPRMKNGIDSRVYWSMVAKNFSAREASESCANSMMVSMLDRPSEMLIGTPIVIMPNSITNRNRIFIAAAPRRRPQYARAALRPLHRRG